MDKFLSRVKSNKFIFLAAVVIVLAVVFRLGMSFGYHRALFDSEWGRNYYNNFYGAGRASAPMMGFSDRGFMGMHGTVGTVIDISSSTVSIKDRNNVERSVAIDGDESIRKGNSDIPVSELKIGDNIAVIGGPNENGQIEAKFIRVFPQQEASSSNIKN